MIFVQASSVAKLIGRNPFEPRSKAIEALAAQINRRGAEKRAQHRLEEATEAQVISAARVLDAPAANLAEALAKEESVVSEALQVASAAHTGAATQHEQAKEALKTTSVRAAAALAEEASAHTRAEKEEAQGKYESLVNQQAALTEECKRTALSASELQAHLQAVEAQSESVGKRKREVMPELQKQVVQRMDTAAIKAEKGDAEAVHKLEATGMAKQVEVCRRMAAGTLGEDAILQMVREIEGLEEADHPEGRPQKLKMGSAGGHPVMLVGVADALAEDCVVEIKRRRNRFLGAPAYERVQCLCYCRLYNTSKAVLAENFGQDLRHHWIDFDLVEWHDIRDMLLEACEEACKLSLHQCNKG